MAYVTDSQFLLPGVKPCFFHFDRDIIPKTLCFSFTVMTAIFTHTVVGRARTVEQGGALWVWIPWHCWPHAWVDGVSSQDNTPPLICYRAAQGFEQDLVLFSIESSLKASKWAGKLAQELKVNAMSSFPGTQVVEGKNTFPQVVLWPLQACSGTPCLI